MQHIQCQHLNGNYYVSMRYIPATDSEYEQYSRLRRLGYYATSEHDGHDRVLITVASNRGHYPSIERYCSYADRDEHILNALSSLYASVMFMEVRA